MEPVPSTVIKTYQERGPLQQFRCASSVSFVCFRCGRAKKSKLITIYGGDWSKKICNGCYGRLLSLYEVKAGANLDDQKVDALASLLLSMATIENQNQTELLLKTSEKRVAHLSAEALRFIVTAEYVASQLEAAPHLEWSPAIIGLCKAIELEIIHRILVPLRTRVSSADLSGDKCDKDLRRVAIFCSAPSSNSVELGTFAHFLQTVIHSQERRQSSTLIQAFFSLIGEWPASHWLLDPSGIHRSLETLTRDFRNKAAHIDELSKDDYLSCRELIMGDQGALWHLVVATTFRSKK